MLQWRLQQLQYVLVAHSHLAVVRASSYHQRPERYGIANLRPDPFYSYVQPAHVDIAKVAYEFIGDCDLERLFPLWEETARAVEQWRER